LLYKALQRSSVSDELDSLVTLVDSAFYVSVQSGEAVYTRCAGEMLVFAGGQQPYQRINVGSNVLRSSFIVHAS